MKIRHFIIILFIYWFLPFIKNQVILDLELFDFINSRGISQQKKKCDTFSLCDPTFDICVSDNVSRICNILTKKTDIFKNQNNVNNVYSSKIALKKIPLDFHIDVFVTDDDYVTKHDPINDFYTNSTPIMNHLYLGFLTPKIYLKDVGFQYKYTFKCDKGFYGDNCDPEYVENSIIYSSLLKQCKSKCRNGVCIVNETNSYYYCNCSVGWQGETCSREINDCDNLFCVTQEIICENHYCYCNSSNDIKILCKKVLESRKQISNILNNNISFYVITGIPICLAFLGVAAFISVTIWRHYYSIPKVSSPLLSNEENPNNFPQFVIYRMNRKEDDSILPEDDNEEDVKLY